MRISGQRSVPCIPIKSYVKKSNSFILKSVKSLAEITDREIEDKIRKAVIRDTWLSTFEIDVKVTDKIAYLDGNVNTYFEKAQADRLASSVRGVREVINNLAVR